MELGKLLIKINSGNTPDKDELREVVEYLELVQSDPRSSAQVSFDDVFESVLVLGRSGAKEYRNLIEYYLESKDPTTVSLVLEILCLYWREAEEYLERLLHFALGAPWDSEGDVRLCSIKILGEYLRSKFQGKLLCQGGLTRICEISQRDTEVVRLMLSIFEDDNADSFLRTQSYISMCRAVGKSWEETPSENIRINFEDELAPIDWELVVALRDVISQK